MMGERCPLLATKRAFRLESRFVRFNIGYACESIVDRVYAERTGAKLRRSGGPT